eukprot:gnl/MRDRNA2_/MRDRNA2_114522_c0_seq1.p1 gnl/MRDRNA2_/MRDRNA2_114522_c0~~gnl/MRDRNA2_/MRDRNA2_114522_c0_seq1.p1  ORF type:complete len:165 (-),score=32.38 gnl/MRDRNA2_/MRDRNA2_114522_c0_seq1:37-531(-)
MRRQAFVFLSFQIVAVSSVLPDEYSYDNKQPSSNGIARALIKPRSRSAAAFLVSTEHQVPDIMSPAVDPIKFKKECLEIAEPMFQGTDRTAEELKGRLHLAKDECLGKMFGAHFTQHARIRKFCNNFVSWLEKGVDGLPEDGPALSLQDFCQRCADEEVWKDSF